MSLTDSYKSCDLEPGVILTKFLILGGIFSFVILIKRILIKKKRCIESRFKLKRLYNMIKSTHNTAQSFGHFD